MVGDAQVMAAAEALKRIEDSNWARDMGFPFKIQFE
jgi:hypothetical protein